jgi:hypothetical protein
MCKGLWKIILANSLRNMSEINTNLTEEEIDEIIIEQSDNDDA